MNLPIRNLSKILQQKSCEFPCFQSTIFPFSGLQQNPSSDSQLFGGCGDRFQKFCQTQICWFFLVQIQAALLLLRLKELPVPPLSVLSALSVLCVFIQFCYWEKSKTLEVSPVVSETLSSPSGSFGFRNVASLAGSYYRKLY